MDASSRVEVMPKMEVTGESGYSTCRVLGMRLRSCHGSQ